MAKGQKRTSREAKKPKANKKKAAATATATRGTVSDALGKPKPGAVVAEKRK